MKKKIQHEIKTRLLQRTKSKSQRDKEVFSLETTNLSVNSVKENLSLPYLSRNMHEVLEVSQYLPSHILSCDFCQEYCSKGYKTTLIFEHLSKVRPLKAAKVLSCVIRSCI